jgi:cytochrome c biogenesis protein ResB
MSKGTAVSVLLFCIIAILIYLQVSLRASPTAVVRYLASQAQSAIGMNASVPANPINTLAKQLNERKEGILEKEKELDQREEIIQGQIRKEQEKTLVYLLATGGVLLFLIVLNFYFDYRRRRRINVGTQR